MAAPLSDKEKSARLRLARSENIGPVTFHDLLRVYGNATRALEAVPELARRGGRTRPIKLASPREAEGELKAIAKNGAELLFFDEADFPLLLAATDPAPPLIIVKGHKSLFARPSIAMVGARNASAAGLRMAGDIARELGAEGYAVTSGLARGIDTAAHKAALETGTMAVIAGGIDVVYPEQNRALQEAIGERGLLISEMPPGTKPQGRHFPRRNRLISGLSLGVIVVEAALRSGSLITARFALEQGRDVMAVPGSPLDPRAGGTNQLIKDGAPLIENAADALAALARQSTDDWFREPSGRDGYGEPPAVPPEISDPERAEILSLLGPTPVEVDFLIRQSGLPARAVAAILLELDLSGKLRREPGQKVALIPPEEA
ncbi:DNA-processing protein DprA [Tepidicaulis sp.]|uniref:DNA-processing protein DprA n=1 Tax=Tepidicaulis sp. TaxID=1920809 RepID=UPI003B5A58E3